MPRVLIPLIDGFEEMEAVAPIDLLRRAGAEVVTAGVAARRVTGSHGIAMEADALLSEVADQDFDMVVLPGGPGTRELRDVAILQHLLRRHVGGGRPVGAICAAPTVLARAGLLRGKRVTCFPGVEGDLAEAIVVREEVVVDGPLITSRGAGTATPFALALVARLCGQVKAEEVARAVIYHGPIQTLG